MSDVFPRSTSVAPAIGRVSCSQRIANVSMGIDQINVLCGMNKWFKLLDAETKLKFGHLLFDEMDGSSARQINCWTQRLS